MDRCDHGWMTGPRATAAVRASLGAAKGSAERRQLDRMVREHAAPAITAALGLAAGQLDAVLDKMRRFQAGREGANDDD